MSIRIGPLWCKQTKKWIEFEFEGDAVIAKETSDSIDDDQIPRWAPVSSDTKSWELYPQKKVEGKVPVRYEIREKELYIDNKPFAEFLEVNESEVEKPIYGKDYYLDLDSAVQTGKMSEVERSIKTNKIEVRKYCGTALDSAIRQQNKEIVDFLLKQNIPRTLAHLNQAAALGNVEIFAALFEGFHPSNRGLALDSAIRQQNKELVDFLLEQDIPVTTAHLEQAVTLENVEIVEVLRKKVEPSKKILERAKKKGNRDIRIALRDKGCYPNYLADAAENGNIAQVAKLLSVGANVNGFDGCGLTALQRAVEPRRKGDVTSEDLATQLKIIELLISGGANINLADKREQRLQHYTAVRRAAYSGYDGIVKYLCDKGANSEGLSTASLLHGIQINDSYKVTRSINEGADVNSTIPRDSNTTALVLAIESRCSVDVIQALLKGGARFAKENILWLAIKHDCDEKVIGALIDADAFVCDNNSCSVLNYAVDLGRSNIVQYLLSRKIYGSDGTIFGERHYKRYYKHNEWLKRENISDIKTLIYCEDVVNKSDQELRMQQEKHKDVQKVLKLYDDIQQLEKYGEELKKNSNKDIQKEGGEIIALAGKFNKAANDFLFLRRHKPDLTSDYTNQLVNMRRQFDQYFNEGTALNGHGLRWKVARILSRIKNDLVALKFLHCMRDYIWHSPRDSLLLNIRKDVRDVAPDDNANELEKATSCVKK